MSMVGTSRAALNTAPHVVVLFGATGDLARRKLLPGLFHLSMSKLAPELRIVGTSLEDLDDDGFRKVAMMACDQSCHDSASTEERDNWARNLSYVPQQDGPDALAAAVRAQAEQLGGSEGREVRLLHYLSVPPAAAIPSIRMVEQAGLAAGATVVMEKPFGTDLASAVALNASIHETFDESQIFRIDHFLGKEPAQNILAFRFANGLFEPIWNRTFIDHIQIDIPEKLSLEGRAAFYEQTGAFKDMVVTHLFQVLAFVAMEAPTELASEAISVEKNKVFRSMVPLDPHNVVRGQYRGYRDEPGVAPDSDTETFVALKCEIDNWRWAGVPFYLRTGKRLQEKLSEIVITFDDVPHSIFDSSSGSPVRNKLTIALQPKDSIMLTILAKNPGETMRLKPVDLSLDLVESFKTRQLDAYERLLTDIIKGNLTLFMRADELDAAWRWIDPIREGWQ
ncbi:MAG TPA: glucose-6-phosphate dehydrogenase, partial [Mycobacterium sp.]|nr:glucose-6-phosphate dehydrogenase [Mycobacterium sp.]